MVALKCDACGGSLTMTNSGEIAVCDFCGMKYTMERIKAKVQEIKGVVEITKGEAEKERLLSNAETFIRINNVNKAEEIYKHLMEEYPNDEIAYVEYLKLLFERLSPEYSHSEYYSLPNPSDLFCNIKEIVAIIQNLCGNSYDNLVDSLWTEHDRKNSNFAIELMQRYKAGEISLYNEIPGLKSAYTPLFEDAMFRAQKMIELIKGVDPSELLEKYPKYYTKVDVDGYIIPEKIQQIKFVTPNGIICSCIGYFVDRNKPSTFDSVYIRFEHSMSVEEIAQIVLRKYNNKCSFCGGDFKGLFTKTCSKCGKQKDY